MIKFSQHSFSGGQLDRDLMGRQDLAKYFVGATTLKNFVVKRQGFIAKRRGTELVCDLDNLFGNGNAIEKARMIPFVADREGGFTLLFACETGLPARIYICSFSGILFSDGVWRPSAQPVTLTDQGDNSSGEASVATPFYLETPYRAADLDGVSYTQSGDILYVAHWAYPFATITRSQNDFAYKVVNFLEMGGEKTLFPPTISATKSGTEGGGATRIVSYIATYVKDGVESLPSSPVYVSYKIPWANTFQINLLLGKGDNSDEPDYYNVYKKADGEYGFVAATTSLMSEQYPLVTFSGNTVFWAEASDGAAVSSGRANELQEAFTRGGCKDSFELFTGVEAYSTSADLIVGGLSSGSGDGLDLVLSGAGASTVIEIVFDIYSFSYSAGPEIDDEELWLMGVWQEGVTVLVTPTYTTSAGEETTLSTKTVLLSERTPTFNNKKLLWRWFDWNLTAVVKSQAELDAIAPHRHVLVDFSEEYNTAFPNGGASLKGLTIVIKDGDTKKNPILSSLRVRAKTEHGNEVYDNFITPDVSLTPPNVENHFDGDGKYPGCVALYTQRLAVGRTKRQPFTVFLSSAGDLLNFNTHASIREDDAIEATIPATEFPEINHLVMVKDLIALCDNGEWVISPVTGNTLSYKTIQIKQQSRVGCSKRLPPQYIGDEVIFSEATGEAIRAFRYNWTQDGYESSDLSVLSGDITRGNPIIDYTYKQHPDSLILCVLSDGSIATLAYMREQELCAWSVHQLGGGLKALCAASDRSLSGGTTGTYLLCSRKEGMYESYRLLRVRDSIPPKTVAAAVCLDSIQSVTAIEGQLVPEAMVAVDVLTGEVLNAGDPLVSQREYLIGYPFEAMFRSIHPEIQNSQTIQLELKGVKSIELRMTDAGGCEVTQTELEDATMNQWVSVPPKMAINPETGAISLEEKTVVVDGAQREDIDGRVSLRSSTPWPLNVLSFSVNYEFDPRLINQNG